MAPKEKPDGLSLTGAVMAVLLPKEKGELEEGDADPKIEVEEAGFENRLVVGADVLLGEGLESLVDAGAALEDVSEPNAEVGGGFESDPAVDDEEPMELNPKNDVGG